MKMVNIIFAVAIFAQQECQIQTGIDNELINMQITEPVKAGMVTFALPKIKKVSDFDRAVEEMHRQKSKCERNA
ncbi:MAG: hypothetical protein V2A72_08940 [Candidatus Omnitrophota bacterium]